MLRRLLARIGAASHRNRLDAELREEIDQHIELRRRLMAAAGIMLAVSLLAAFIPAQRASRVDPAIALRAE